MIKFSCFTFYSTGIINSCVLYSQIYFLGRLSPIAQDVIIDDRTYEWAEGFLNKYIDALVANLEKRFEKLPVVAAFSIFHVEDLPNRDDPSFQDYGKDNIKQLSQHFGVSLYLY